MSTELAKPENGQLQTAASSAPSESQQRDVRWVRPRIDVLEGGDSHLVLADLPGVTPEHLQVHYEQGELRVEAWPTPLGNDTMTRAYRLRLEIGEGVDPEGISAELSQGVLRVELKKAPALRARRIEVRAG